MRFRLTFLGTGTSSGVPLPGCECPTCASGDPRDKRRRSSLLVQFDGRNVVIDCGADFREQALSARLKRLDALLITHDHADHLHGIDDVRSFNFVQAEPVRVHLSAETAAGLRTRFAYIFGEAGPGGGRPRIELVEFDSPFDLFGERVAPVPVVHGLARTHGFRFGPFAYLPDVKSVPESAMPLLRGLETLIIDALRPREHPTHLSIDEAVALSAELAPRQTYLTHFGHKVLHADVAAGLPEGVELAHDGLVIECG